MIDYEKLKQAHEMCLGTSYMFQVQFGFAESLDIELFQPNKGEWILLCRLKKLDHLISKLTELTPPKPKYEVGQTIWFLDDENEICNFKIASINFYLNEYNDERGDHLCVDSKIYPSKQALIEAQIEYWSNLRKGEYYSKETDWHFNTPIPSFAQCCSLHVGGYEECAKECEHENDGLVYYVLVKDIWRYCKRCKKCAKFYR